MASTLQPVATSFELHVTWWQNCDTQHVKSYFPRFTDVGVWFSNHQPVITLSMHGACASACDHHDILSGRQHIQIQHLRVILPNSTTPSAKRTTTQCSRFRVIALWVVPLLLCRKASGELLSTYLPPLPLPVFPSIGLCTCWLQWCNCGELAQVTLSKKEKSS